MMESHVEIEIEFKNMIIAVPKRLINNVRSGALENYCIELAKLNGIKIYKSEEVKN